jgi:hypothetical protein
MIAFDEECWSTLRLMKNELTWSNKVGGLNSNGLELVLENGCIERG